MLQHLRQVFVTQLCKHKTHSLDRSQHTTIRQGHNGRVCSLRLFNQFRREVADSPKPGKAFPRDSRYAYRPRSKIMTPFSDMIASGIEDYVGSFSFQPLAHADSIGVAHLQRPRQATSSIRRALDCSRVPAKPVNTLTEALVHGTAYRRNADNGTSRSLVLLFVLNCP